MFLKTYILWVDIGLHHDNDNQQQVERNDMVSMDGKTDTEFV